MNSITQKGLQKSFISLQKFDTRGIETLVEFSPFTRSYRVKSVSGESETIPNRGWKSSLRTY